MKIGAKDSESYLKDWHKRTVPLQSIGPKAIEVEAARLEQDYDTEKLKALILNNGWSKVVS
jgi:hypothetical protein